MTMQKDITSIISNLKGIVDRKGSTYLTDKPYEVYLELIESTTADRKTAAAILHLLVSDLMGDVRTGYDTAILSEIIQRECSLNKRMSDRLALIMYSLYSEANRNEWRRREHEGLRRFLKEKFTCTWKGFAVWDAGNGTVDCHYEAEIVLVPTEAIKTDKKLVQQLKKNSFLTKEAIHDLFAERLEEYLDNKFDYYCTCDNYYQPVVEDYGSNLEYELIEWCKENGFNYVSCEGAGEDDGYEPKYRNGWY